MPSGLRSNGIPKCSSSYTTCGAILHMYSIASWSPSQSEPLIVSYMCQSQLSSDMLPSDAPMPPCAATVCERVGNTLDSTATDSPGLGELQRRAHARAAGADDDRVELADGQRSRRGHHLPAHRIWIVHPA